MQLLTLQQLAEQSGWPVSRIRRMLAHQQLPHVRVGGRILVPNDAIATYLSNNFVSAQMPRSGIAAQAG